jgi:flagellin
MADTFRLDFVGTKAGIKGASVTMGYLETGMRVLDSASALLSRLQELAVLGANDTNTTADHEAINLEAEAIGDEFNRLMTTSSDKGRDVFNTTAGSLYVSMGGRDQEMTFGIGRIDYTPLYTTTGQTIAAATTTVDGPNKGAVFNLAHLPSDAVVAKEYGLAAATIAPTGTNADTLKGDTVYVIDAVGTEVDFDNGGATQVGPTVAAASKLLTGNTYAAWNKDLAVNDVLKTNDNAATFDVAGSGPNNSEEHTYKEVNSGSNAFKAGDEFEIVSLGTSNGNTATANSDAASIAAATSIAGGTLTIGQKFTVNSDANAQVLARLNALEQNMTFRRSSDTLTKDIEAMQGLVNTARVQAGSQYAAIESAVNYTTDLTAQYELGYNTVNDVNFSMETAHLAKNQILQQAATAMLAQANQGQQGLLQLIS